MHERILNPESLNPEKLLENTQGTKKIWNILKEKGTAFETDPYGWHGFSSNVENKIVVGGQKAPDEFKEYLNLKKDTPDEAVKMHIMSHEVMHHVLYQIEKDHDHSRQELEKYINLIKSIRSQTDRGISRLGSHPFYANPNHGHPEIEDVVETFNYYGQNPENLKQYLAYLSTADKEVLDSKGLVRLAPAAANHVYASTEGFISGFLRKHS